MENVRKNATSENSYLKNELLAVEKKLQLALPALPMMRGRRPRGVVEGQRRSVTNANGCRGHIRVGRRRTIEIKLNDGYAHAS